LVLVFGQELHFHESYVIGMLAHPDSTHRRTVGFDDAILRVIQALIKPCILIGIIPRPKLSRHHIAISGVMQLFEELVVGDLGLPRVKHSYRHGR